MRKVTVVSDLELAILGLLREQPRSGYELRKVFATTAIGLFSDSPGAVYPALRRLTAAALIEGSTDESTRRGKETFRLTAAGRRALRDELARPATEEDVATDPDRLMLRFAFMEPELGRDAAIRFLESYASSAAGYTAELRRDRKDLPDRASITARLALEQGIALYAARSRWAVQAVKTLRQRRKPALIMRRRE